MKNYQTEHGKSCICVYIRLYNVVYIYVSLARLGVSVRIRAARETNALKGPIYSST